MATISKEELEELKEAKLYSKDDCASLAKLSKELGFRDGKGYTSESFRNFILRSSTMSDDVHKVIIEFYDNKRVIQKENEKRKRSLLKKLKEEVA
jgi:hypothetical protein